MPSLYSRMLMRKKGAQEVCIDQLLNLVQIRQTTRTHGAPGRDLDRRGQVRREIDASVRFPGTAVGHGRYARAILEEGRGVMLHVASVG